MYLDVVLEHSIIEPLSAQWLTRKILANKKHQESNFSGKPEIAAIK